MTSVGIDPIPPPQPESARAGPAAGTPPITAPLAALARYAASHHHALLAADWQEGTGTLLQVITRSPGCLEGPMTR
jgi:hypothetical protein